LLTHAITESDTSRIHCMARYQQATNPLASISQTALTHLASARH